MAVYPSHEEIPTRGDMYTNIVASYSYKSYDTIKLRSYKTFAIG